MKRISIAVVAAGDAPSDKHASFMPIAQASCVRQVCATKYPPVMMDGKTEMRAMWIVVARAPGAPMTMPACKMPIAAVNYVWPRSVNHSRHAKMASRMVRKQPSIAAEPTVWRAPMVRCGAGADCVSTFCGSGTCQDPPRCDDEIANGNETGQDCGGPDCEPCSAGEQCDVDGDCLSGGCRAGLCGTISRWDQHLIVLGLLVLLTTELTSMLGQVMRKDVLLVGLLCGILGATGTVFAFIPKMYGFDVLSAVEGPMSVVVATT